MQHALISSFRVVLLNCMVRQIDKFIVSVDVKFFGSQSDLEAVVNPGHKWSRRGDDGPDPYVKLAPLLE